MTPGNRASTLSVPEFQSIHVFIEYTVRQPVDGVQFVLQSETYPQVWGIQKYFIFDFEVSLVACPSCVYNAEWRSLLGSLR